MTINEINESVNGAKDWAKHYLGLEKKMRYKIRVNSKYGNRDYEGDNSQDNALSQFCTVLDDAIKDSRTTTIEIEFTDWKKTEKQTFPTIIMQNDIVMPGGQSPSQEQKKEQSNTLDSNMMNMLGVAFGLQGLGQANTEAGTGGVLIAATRQSMQREFDKQRQDEKIGAMTEEIRALKARITELEQENKKLTKRCDELEDENEELADAQEKLDKLQSKHEKIAAIGGMMLGNIVEQFVAKSPLAGLFGVAEETAQIPQQQVQQPQQPRQRQEEETPTVIQIDDEDDDKFIAHPIERV